MTTGSVSLNMGGWRSLGEFGCLSGKIFPSGLCIIC